VVSVAVVGAVLFGVLANTSAGAPEKPARDLVPAEASALYWSYSMPLPGGSKYGTLKITNPAVIAKVRTLINAIPVANYSKLQACPANYMIPYVISFSKSSQARSFTKVEFELGGCPTATVYQNGKAESPALGGFGLVKWYAAIQKVISPRGQPLA
jgi:hypothetical protein